MNYCLCCGNSAALAEVICERCAALPVLEAVKVARMTADRERKLAASIDEGKQALRKAQLFAGYAIHGKRCACCHAFKPLAEYSTCTSRVDGLQPHCRGCNSLRASMINSGQSLAQWHTVREALRKANTEGS